MKRQRTTAERARTRAREARALQELQSGPGLFARTFSFVDLRRVRAPEFIRRSYEAEIIERLNEFYRRRPRPWRPRSHSACKPTHKERMKALRAARHNHALKETSGLSLTAAR